MSGIGLDRAAYYCYSVVKVVIGCISFLLKREKKVVEGGTKKEEERKAPTRFRQSSILTNPKPAESWDKELQNDLF